jgi:hypothetical protein
MIENARPSRRPLRVALGCVTAAIIIVAFCAGIQVWLTTPKIKVADVEKQVSQSLPTGTPKEKVEAWLGRHSMTIQVYHDEANGNRIQSWIPDSGPRGGWPFGIRDICLIFVFDESDHLIDFKAVEEERF